MVTIIEKALAISMVLYVVTCYHMSSFPVYGKYGGGIHVRE